MDQLKPDNAKTATDFQSWHLVRRALPTTTPYPNHQHHQHPCKSALPASQLSLPHSSRPLSALATFQFSLPLSSRHFSLSCLSALTACCSAASQLSPLVASQLSPLSSSCRLSALATFQFSPLPTLAASRSCRFRWSGWCQSRVARRQRLRRPRVMNSKRRSEAGWCG